MRTVSWGSAAASLVLVLAACSSDKPQPQPQPQPTVAPAPAPVPDPEPAADGGSGGSQAGAGGAATAAPEPKRPSGRPAILMGPSKEINSTFGLTPGSVLKLKGDGGTITFRIPEYALAAPANITLKLLTKAVKTKGRVIGSIVSLEAGKPGGSTQSAYNAAEGNKFELVWPLNKQPSVNLAIGTIDVDSDGRPGPMRWKVVAPTSVDTGFGEATFHVTVLGPMQYYHATTSAVIEGS